MSRKIKSGTYRLETIDDQIDQDLQKEVFEHLMDSEYCLNFYDHPHSIWHPRSDTLTTPRTLPAQPRLPIAWDETSLRDRDPIIYRLWQTIDQITNHEFLLEGIPEGMNCMTGISPLSSIPGQDGSSVVLKSAWRVYGSGNEREPGARTKSIHRDCPDLDLNDQANIVYFSNVEWHPSFYGETMFHGNINHTGDYTGRFHKDQKRNFPIGDIENIVEPRPGRFMIFDARYLHQVKPSSEFSFPILGIVFRCKINPRFKVLDQ